MSKEEFIGKLQLCYFGDRNAFNEIVSVYDDLQNKIDKAIEYINKKENMKMFTGAFSYGEFIGTLEEVLKGDNNEC